MEPVKFPLWIAVSEWLQMPKEIRSDLEPRHVFVGGAIVVYETSEEAEKERRKAVENAMKGIY
jgi:hypothetical protein